MHMGVGSVCVWRGVHTCMGVCACACMSVCACLCTGAFVRVSVSAFVINA